MGLSSMKPPLPEGHRKLLHLANSIGKEKANMRSAESSGDMKAAKIFASKVDSLIEQRRKLVKGTKK